MSASLSRKNKIIGSAYIHTAASHTSTGSTLAPLSSAGGGTPRIEFDPSPATFSTLSVTTPKIGVNGLPAGKYRVTMNVTTGASAGNASLAINDGTTTSGYTGFDVVTHGRYLCVGYFTYTAPITNVVYELWAASDSGPTVVYASGSPNIGAGFAWDVHFTIEKVDD